MSKAEKTKEFIIEKSAPIFNKKGYAGTSLTDLIDATGLTKGSIYGNFANKNEVAIAVYRHNIDLLTQHIRDFLLPTTTATERLIGITDYYRAHYKRIFEQGGCPILNASVEADDNLHFLKKDVQVSIKNFARSIEKIIIRGQKSHEFKKNINANDYAYTYITVLEGGMMLAKIMNHPKFLFAALDRITKIINTEIKK